MISQVVLPNTERPVEPRVALDLSLEEFTILEALRYRHLNGFSPVRTALERGFDEATAALDPYWQKRVDRAREVKGFSNIIEQVAEALWS